MSEPADGNETRQDRNVEVVRRFIDGWVNGGDPNAIDETWSEDMSWHGGSLGTYHGKDAFKQFTKANAAGAFADMHLEIHEVITHSNKVVARFTNSGTNIGPFLNNPPTGRYVEWLGIGIYTLRDGRITEGWFAEDILGMLIQLRAIAPPDDVPG